MARDRVTARPGNSGNPGFLERLRARPARHEASQDAEYTHKKSRNPITGTETTKTKKKVHPPSTGRTSAGQNNMVHHRNGDESVGRRGHGGGPLASERPQGPPVSHRQRRKPGIGDKISGGLMKMKGEVERKPGVKAAGTRRMHGTDGRIDR